MIKKIISLLICFLLVISSVSIQYANDNLNQDEMGDTVVTENATINNGDEENDVTADERLTISTSSDVSFDDSDTNEGDEEKGSSESLEPENEKSEDTLLSESDKTLSKSDDDTTISTSSEIDTTEDIENDLDANEIFVNNDKDETLAPATLSEIDDEDGSLLDEYDLSIIATDSELVLEATASTIFISTESEIKETGILEYLHGYTGKGIIQKKKNFKVKNLDDGLFGDGDLPASYDARQEVNPNNTSMSIISPVRTQNYGDCWAHATIALIEASIRKKGLVTTEAESNLSEAALLYNSYHLENITNGSTHMDKPGLEGNDYITRDGYSYLSGGDPIEALVMASSYMCFVTENEDTKYDKMDDIIDNGLDGKYAFNSNSFVLANAETIASFGSESDRNKMKKAIMDYGAIQLPINCSPTGTNAHQHGEDWYY